MTQNTQQLKPQETPFLRGRETQQKYDGSRVDYGGRVSLKQQLSAHTTEKECEELTVQITTSMYSIADTCDHCAAPWIAQKKSEHIYM